MIFYKRITICNLYSYYGKQSVEFEEKNDKNVYLIYGRNGFGKTSFITALNILFSGTPISNKIDTNLEDKRSSENIYFFGKGNSNSGIFNNKAIEEESNEFFVSLNLNHDGKEILIKRSWKRFPYLEEKLIYHEIGDEIIEGNLAQEHINAILPKSFVEFFIFDGEKIGKLAEHLKSELKNKILELLNITSLKKAKSDIKKLRNEYYQENTTDQEKQIELKQLNSDLEILEDKIDLTKDKIKQNNSYLVDLEKDLSQKSKNKDDIISNKGKAEGQLQAEIKSLEERLAENKNNFKNNSHSFLFLNLDELSNELLELINENKKSKNIKTNQLENIKDDFSKKLGEKLSLKLAKKNLILDSFDARDLIIETFSEIINSENKSYFDGFEFQNLDNKLNNALKDAEILKNSIVNIKEISKNIDAKKRKLDEILNQDKDEELEQQTKEINSLKIKISDVQKEKFDLENNEKNHLNEREELNNKIQELSNLVHKNKRLETQIKLCDDLKSGIEFYEEKLVDKLRLELEVEILKNYKKLLNDDNIFKIEVDTNFDIILKSKNGNEVLMTSQSAGQKQIMAIAIFWAISSLSKRILPLIIDTPLARIDRENRNNIVKNYYSSASNQVIIFPNGSTEFSEENYNLIKDKIADSFIIDNDENRNNSSIIKKSMKEILELM